MSNSSLGMAMIQRIYRQKIVSNLTLEQIEKIIEKEGIEYSGDYGLKAYKDVRLVFSLN
jgi:hypothetical protein